MYIMTRIEDFEFSGRLIVVKTDMGETYGDWVDGVDEDEQRIKAVEEMLARLGLPSKNYISYRSGNGKYVFHRMTTPARVVYFDESEEVYSYQGISCMVHRYHSRVQDSDGTYATDVKSYGSDEVYVEVQQQPLCLEGGPAVCIVEYTPEQALALADALIKAATNNTIEREDTQS